MAFITSLRFPLNFDVERLQSDLQHVLQHNWVAHYNKGAYSGNWTSLALLSAGGSSSAINAMPKEGEQVVETEIMSGCNYFREVLNSFRFEKTTARLLSLEAGAEIKPHKDYCLGYEDGVFRLHIPVITNPDVEFVLAGERVIMEEGSCWYINANEEHSVANRGTENRIHLVIDGKRNTWTDELFFSVAPEADFIRPEREMSHTEKSAMIAELERLGTPVALELIQQLKEQQ